MSLDPDAVATQAELARAMAEIRRDAGLSLGDIAAGSSISKTTASNIVTIGRHLPSRESLSAFLRACRVAPGDVETWVAALGRLQEPSRPVGERATFSAPDDPLWRELLALPLVARLTRRDGAPAFPQVRELVDRAVATLSEPYETAPAYIRHDARHAVDVVGRINDLLGDAVRDLTPGETQLLILGAFLHDVGRAPGAVPPSAHRRARYLDEHPDATLEDFCRADRADRLDDYLRTLPPRLLTWDRVPIREVLSAVCRGNPPRTFRDADTAFCADLLRLARRCERCGLQPAEDIYRRLGIPRRAEPRGDVEWAEHVGSLTIRTAPHGRDYTAMVEAVPLRPVVEFDLRRMLDALDTEFRRCRDARDSWTGRWSRLPLPRSVDRSGIHGVGYTYEQLTFELARDDVLELFAGARLYGNQQVFVRELLQNAVDAVRLRALLDRRPEQGSVAITVWEDADSIWFRIDDDGIGMDLHTIREYFLRIGRSYYNSEDLTRELRRNGQAGASFRAISRFGIGIMSCFMLGDRIEVSTRRFHPRAEDGPALRLSLNKQEDFVVLRQRHEGDDPMPAAPGEPRFDFRETPGTSVAVHIDSLQHNVLVRALLDQAAQFHFDSSTMLRLNGEVHQARQLDRPLIDGLRSFELDADRWSAPTNTTMVYYGPVRIWTVPLNLTAASPDPRVRGQLVAFVATVDRPQSRSLIELWPPSIRAELGATMRKALQAIPMTIEAGTTLRQAKLHCSVPSDLLDDFLSRHHLRRHMALGSRDFRTGVREHLRSRGSYSDAEVAVLSDLYGRRSGMTSDRQEYIFEHTHSRLDSFESFSRGWWWSHNGITLPVRSRWEHLEHDDGDVEISRFALNSTALASKAFFTGILAFFDELRPGLSLARDEVQHIPFAMAAALQLAVRRALPTEPPPALTGAILAAGHDCPLSHEEDPVLDAVLAAADAVEGGWPAERIFHVDGRVCTLADVAAAVQAKEVVIDCGSPPWSYQASVVDLIGYALAQRRLTLVWRPSGGRHPGAIIAVSDTPREPVAGLGLFRPLLFLRYETGTDLRDEDGPFNATHPFCRWLISRAAEIKRRTPGLFSRLQETLFRSLGAAELSLYVINLAERDGVDPIDYLAAELLPADENVIGYDAYYRVVGIALLHDLAARIGRAAPDLAPPDEVFRSLAEAAEAAGGY